MKKLSIIIPVYNVEKYIAQCLQSCVEQVGVSHDDYEIIVVNDGSPDNSMGIVNEYINAYPSLITIYNQKNAGLSVARNSGIKVATGEFLWFVDSDDWILENAVEKIIRKLNEFEDLDLLNIQAKEFNGKDTNNTFLYRYYDCILSGYECINKGGLPCCAVVTIYRKSFLEKNNLFFFPGILHEDIEFKPRAVYLANRIAFLDDYCYVVRREGQSSITSTYKIKNALGHIAVLNSLYHFSKQLPYDIRRYFNYQQGSTMNSMLLGIHSLNKVERDEIIKRLKNCRFVFRNMRKAGSLKYFIEGMFLSLNIRICVWLHGKMIRIYR